MSELRFPRDKQLRIDHTNLHPPIDIQICRRKKARILLSKPHVFTSATGIMLSLPEYSLLWRDSGREAHRCAGALDRALQGEGKCQIRYRCLHRYSYRFVPHMGLWPRSQPFPSAQLSPPGEKILKKCQFQGKHTSSSASLKGQHFISITRFLIAWDLWRHSDPETTNCGTRPNIILSCAHDRHE